MPARQRLRRRRPQHAGRADHPPACTTLTASQNLTAGALPDESTLDTSRIQAALNGCASGMAVKLATGGGNNAFITGPLTLPTGVTLWVDAGATLFGTRNPTSTDRPRRSSRSRARTRASSATE